MGLENDLDFYESVTDDNGPAMTWSMFAVNWFDRKDYQRSAAFFKRGFANMAPPFGVWTEYPATFENQGAINFITGAGGFLQSLVFGTSGLRIKAEGLSFNPPPPSATGTGASRLTVHSLHYLGSRLRQEVTEETITLCLVDENQIWHMLRLGQPLGSKRTQVEVKACGSASAAQGVLRKFAAKEALTYSVGSRSIRPLVFAAVVVFLLSAVLLAVRFTVCVGRRATYMTLPLSSDGR